MMCVVITFCMIGWAVVGKKVPLSDWEKEKSHTESIIFDSSEDQNPSLLFFALLFLPPFTTYSVAGHETITSIPCICC